MNLRNRVETSLGVNVLTDNPQRARIILLVPSFNRMVASYRKHLLSDPLVTRYLNRCFVLESSDTPADYLRGCYVSMPKQRFDKARHRAIGFLYHGDGPHTAEIMGMQPSRLFSFRGAASHPIRSRILEQLGDTPDGAVSLTGKWLNYSDEEYRSFWQQLGSSRFVLCPRGIGTASVRAQETMQAGRVPVIISDDWVPPIGPEWPTFSLRVSEAEVAEIPSLLRSREDDAAEMGRAAREAWVRYYEPRSAFVPWLVDLIDQLDGDSSDWNAHREIRRWSSAGFRWSQKFDPLHSALRVARRTAARLK